LFASVDDKELHLWEEMESNEDLSYLMDEKKRKLRKESDKRMGS
jgi:antirestriction protein